MKLYIETMGCPKNFNDSESIGGIWESTGMSLTDDPAEADAILGEYVRLYKRREAGVDRLHFRHGEIHR